MEMIHQKRIESRVRRIRLRIFAVSFLLWVLMACWTLSAFWADIEKLGGGMGRYVGAMSAEFTILVLIYWHAFDEHISVRQLALILSIALSVCAIIHAGALTGMAVGDAEAATKRKALSEELTSMTNGMVSSETDKRTRRAAMAAAQRQLVEHVEKEKKVETLLPEWYTKWMYTGMFVISVLAFGLVVWVRSEKGDMDIDSNFDGIADREQPHLFPALSQPQIHYLPAPPLREIEPQQSYLSPRIVGMAPPIENGMTVNSMESRSIYFDDPEGRVRATPGNGGWAIWQGSAHQGSIRNDVWESLPEPKTAKILLSAAKRRKKRI